MSAPSPPAVLTFVHSCTSVRFLISLRDAIDGRLTDLRPKGSVPQNQAGGVVDGRQYQHGRHGSGGVVVARVGSGHAGGGGAAAGAAARAGAARPPPPGSSLPGEAPPPLPPRGNRSNPNHRSVSQKHAIRPPQQPYEPQQQAPTQQNKRASRKEIDGAWELAGHKARPAGRSHAPSRSSIMPPPAAAGRHPGLDSMTLAQMRVFLGERGVDFAAFVEKRDFQEGVAKRLDDEATYGRVVQEIVATERAYVNDLGTVLDVFVGGLSQSAEEGVHLASKEQLNILFGNLRSIYELNKQLLVDLISSATYAAAASPGGGGGGAEAMPSTAVPAPPAYGSASFGSIFLRFGPFLKM